MKLNFRYILVFLLLIVCLRVVAQGKKHPVKIIMTYAVGGNSWGQPGVYSREERFELSVLNARRYKITKYLKINRIVGEDGGTIARDTIEIGVDGLSSVSIQKIDSLYVQLGTTKENFNTAFIKPQLIKPTEKQILALARKYNKYYKFEGDDRSDTRGKIKRMKDFDKLDDFIKLNKPNPDLSFVVVDAWNSMTISYIYASDTVKYWSEFHQLLGQPVEPLLNRNADLVRNTVNLEINLLIESMLPKSSLLRKQISLNSLTEAYIHWYIDTML